MIVAPHPDDEVFGCCGLMQRLIAQGKRVELIIMTGVVKVMLAVVTLMKAS
ncbi:MAG: PIG-L deacetylase family protein [Segatella copri]